MLLIFVIEYQLWAVCLELGRLPSKSKYMRYNMEYIFRGYHLLCSLRLEVMESKEVKDLSKIYATYFLESWSNICRCKRNK